LLIAVLLIVLALLRRELGGAVVLAAAVYVVLSHARYLGMFAITVVTLGSTLLEGDPAARPKIPARLSAAG
jgi:hypothetical protein